MRVARKSIAFVIFAVVGLLWMVEMTITPTGFGTQGQERGPVSMD